MRTACGPGGAWSTHRGRRASATPREQSRCPGRCRGRSISGGPERQAGAPIRSIFAPYRLGAMMTSKKSPLDKAFIEKQHLLLTKLRAQLQAATRGQEAEESGIHADSAGEAHEFEDNAQKLALLELDDTAVARSAQRLAQIERALQKIAVGH